MSKVTIKGVNREYPIFIKKGLLNDINTIITDVFKGTKILIISDNNVAPLYGATIVKQLESDFDVLLHVIESGEKSKSFSNVGKMYHIMNDFNMTRNDLVIAIGGGVVGDFAGYVSATYMRGIDYVQIPTTLLSQVDSSVGSKVAVDLEKCKNLIGCFYDPLCVVVDPLCLDTLSDVVFKDGMAEVIKYAFIDDVDLFNLLSGYDNKSIVKIIDEVIYKCILIKQKYVQDDFFDKGLRMKLNFGHTIGHAIESFYGFEKYSHGLSVAIGMALITKVSEFNNQSDIGTYKQVVELLNQYQLPISDDVLMDELQEYLLKDKKRDNNLISFILLERVGKSFVYKTDLNYVLKG